MKCSIQRRFQKIVEEAPSVDCPTPCARRSGGGGQQLASAANYHTTGTVEFIPAPDGAFYFLEMNTRLQVEHPVTEMVTGIDLVRKQVEIAAGQGPQPRTGRGGAERPCHRMPHLCRGPDERFPAGDRAVLLLDPPTDDHMRFENGLTRGPVRHQ